MKRKVDPILKIRYSKGLGDIIRCFLHSRYFGPITKLLTKKDHTCIDCSIRANAYNIIIPIPVWKMFFKDEQTMNKIFEKDLLDYGYRIVNENELANLQDDASFDASPKEKPCCGNTNAFLSEECIKYEGYYLSSKTEEEYSNLKVVTLEFRKI